MNDAGLGLGVRDLIARGGVAGPPGDLGLAASDPFTLPQKQPVSAFA